MDIDEMEAGHELDMLVAEKVMGRVSKYSTRITAAWEIVEEFRFAIWPSSDGVNKLWSVAQSNNSILSAAKEAPLAICRAALKVGHKEKAAEADCQHKFFKCQVPAGDSCQPIYHDVCRKCRWDKRKGIYMPMNIWHCWAVPQLRKLDEGGQDGRVSDNSGE